MTTLSPEKDGHPRKRRSGVVVPHAPRWHQRLVAWVLVTLIKLVALTLRYRWRDEAGILGPDFPPGPVIFATWHNRLALAMRAYRHSRRRRPSAGMAAMVSASKDGGFLAAVLECFGVQPVRGSSSRRGSQALLELTTWSRRGYDLAITPDGPRGPCYRVQDGVIYLAQVTGQLIVPFSFRAHSKIRVRSWDRFQIPLPFSRCDMVVGKPIRVGREISDEVREACRDQLERELVRITAD